MLSACRTALGDSDSELGFAGLALQAGSRSAIGTLWYVDDVATSAYFLQLYRYLDQGVQKADALRATRQAMATGKVRLQGDKVIGSDGIPPAHRTDTIPAAPHCVRNGPSLFLGRRSVNWDSLVIPWQWLSWPVFLPHGPLMRVRSSQPSYSFSA